MKELIIKYLQNDKELLNKLFGLFQNQSLKSNLIQSNLLKCVATCFDNITLLFDYIQRHDSIFLKPNTKTFCEEIKVLFAIRLKLFEKNTNPTLKIPIVTLNIMKIEFAIIDRIIELLRVIPTISDINLPFQLTTKKENIKPKFSLNTTKKPVVTKPKNVSTLKKEIKPVLDKSKSTVNKKSVNTSKNLFTLSILDTTNNSTDLSNTTNESSIKVGLDKKNIESNNTVNTPPLNMKNLYSKQIIESLSKAKNYTYNVPLNQSIPLSPFLSSSFDKNNEDVEIQAIPFSPPKILHNSLKENGSKPQFCDSPMQIKKEEVNSNTSFELSNSSKEILKNANSSGGNNYLSNSFESKFINLNPPSFNLSSITALDTNSIK